MPKRKDGESKSAAATHGVECIPLNDPECRCGEFCVSSIWSTPRNPENHARQIKRIVDRCTRTDTQLD